MWPQVKARANAELANGLVADAKTSIDKALGMPVKSAELFWVASRVHATLGAAAASTSFLARAKTLNPRIETKSVADAGKP